MSQTDSEQSKSENNGKKKYSPKDIPTVTGTRQDVIDEMNRLVRELEQSQRLGETKMKQKLSDKDQSYVKSLEPSVEKDTSENLPIDGDHIAGSRIFMRFCATCHSLEANNQGIASVQGPALGLIYGKKAGSDKYFDYSSSYVKSQRVWNEKNLFKYLFNPKAEYIDSKCLIAGGGLKDEGDRADVIRFLRLFTKNLKVNLDLRAKKTFGKDYIDAYQEGMRKTNESAYIKIKRSQNNNN